MEPIDLDLRKPADCRTYIQHFQDDVFGKVIHYVNFSGGRRVQLAEMNDQDAITIANQFYEWEARAGRLPAEEAARFWLMYLGVEPTP